MGETLASLSKELLLKAGVKEIIPILDKKSNSEEVSLEIKHLRS
jgi:hypothetical protein